MVTMTLLPMVRTLFYEGNKRIDKHHASEDDAEKYLASVGKTSRDVNWYRIDRVNGTWRTDWELSPNGTVLPHPWQDIFDKASERRKREVAQTIEEGFMRVFDNDGKHVGDTPVLNWKCTDGSYGLLESLEGNGVPGWVSVAHDFERRAMELFKTKPDAMLRWLGYSAIYIPKN